MSASETSSPREQLLAALVQALGSAQDALSEYLDAADSEQGDSSAAAHAREYAETAALLRCRAQQLHRSEPDRADLERRARWFEARAEVKRSGAPMPPELRTPLEGLQLVDDLRHELLDLSNLVQDVSAGELDAFLQALVPESNPPPGAGEALRAALGDLQRAAGTALDLLGARHDEAGTVRFLPVKLTVAATRR